MSAEQQARAWVDRLPSRVFLAQTREDLYGLLDEGERLGFTRAHVQHAIVRTWHARQSRGCRP